MDKIKLLLTIFSFLLGIVGCNQKKDISISTVDLIDVPIERNDASGLFDSIFEMSRYVPLEVTDESLIRRVGKIIFYRNTVYVLDTEEKRVLAFDKNGKFLKKYEHIGQGPGEYLSLVDFTIKGDTLYLLDRNVSQLLLYNLEDSLLQTQKVPKAKGIYVLGSEKYAFNEELGAADNSSNKEYYSYSLMEHGKKKLRRVSYNKELCGLSFSLSEGANSFYYYQDSIYTYFPFNDTIYCVNEENGELSPYLRVKIGDERIGLEDDKKQIDALRKKISSTIFAFYKWDEAILFSYYNNNENRKYVFADKTGKVLFTGAFGLDRNKLPVRVIAYHSDKKTGELLSINYPHELIGLAKYHAEKSPVLKEIVGHISEEGNPILVFYNLREKRNNSFNMEEKGESII